MSRFFIHIVCCLYFLIMLSGCSTFKLIKEKNDTWQTSIFSADLPVDWVKYTTYGSVLLMTKDGVFLQSIMISKRNIDKKFPRTKRKIQKDMLIHEIATLLVDELVLDVDLTDLVILAKKPVDIDGKKALKLEYTFKNRDALKYHVLSYIFLLEEKLYKINFQATEQHHFQKNLLDFQKFLESFRMNKDM